MLMLDEPASGLSRGERQLLTELLLGLDPSITLILIEHDMDIALTRRAQRDDDARRAGHRRGHPGRDPGQPDRPRPVPRSADMAPSPPPRPSLPPRPRRCSRSRGSTRSTEGARARRPELHDGARLARDRRPQRDGQDHALQRDHGHRAAAGRGLDPLRGQGARRRPVAQDRPARHRLRPAGASPLPVAHRRRAPADRLAERGRRADGRASGRASASTSSSRGSPSASATAAHSSRAASSRCSRSGARWSRIRAWS